MTWHPSIQEIELCPHFSSWLSSCSSSALPPSPHTSSAAGRCLAGSGSPPAGAPRSCRPRAGLSPPQLPWPGPPWRTAAGCGSCSSPSLRQISVSYPNTNKYAHLHLRLCVLCVTDFKGEWINICSEYCCEVRGCEFLSRMSVGEGRSFCLPRGTNGRCHSCSLQISNYLFSHHVLSHFLPYQLNTLESLYVFFLTTIRLLVQRCSRH